MSFKVSLKKLLPIASCELCCIQKVNPDHSSKALLQCWVKLAKRKPGPYHNKRFRESVDTHEFHHNTAALIRTKMQDTSLMQNHGQGRLVEDRALQYQMPLPECVKLTYDFAI